MKDQFDIKGHLNTGGCNAYGDNIAREDSTIITGEIKDLRIGVLEQMMGDEVESETRLLVQRAIDVLKDLGATVEPVSIPLIERMHGVHTAICDGQAASYHRGHLRARYMAYDYNTRVRLLVGCLIPAGLQTLAGRIRALMGQTLLETFETYDVLVEAPAKGPPAQSLPSRPSPAVKQRRQRCWPAAAAPGRSAWQARPPSPSPRG